MNTEIIVTLGEEAINKNPEETIEKMLQYEIKNFRINLSRYQSERDFCEHIELINKFRPKYKNDISIIIDLPYPNEKIRIYHKSKEYKHISKNEHIIVESKNSFSHRLDAFIANVDNIDQLIQNYKGKIIYADGEITFSCYVVDHKKKSIELVAEQDGIIFSRKSLSFGRIIKSQIDLQKILSNVLDVNPDALALSFVENETEVEWVIELLSNKKNINVFSKIENFEGIRNIDAISQKSDIIVARGDLMLNTNIVDFGLYQSNIIKTAKSHEKQVAVATGILSSMANRCIPTQAELIDLYCLKREKVDYVVLNYGLVRGDNFNKAIEIIKYM